MKKIRIFQRDNETIELEDSDDKNLHEYIDDLEKLFDSDTVIKIKTENKGGLIRPSQITSVIVEEFSKKKDVIKDGKKKWWWKFG